MTQLLDPDLAATNGHAPVELPIGALPRTTTRIVVIGCGHVGLIMAAGLASLGHQVTGIDRNAKLVADLSVGEVALHEAGLTELVAEGLASGRLSFTTTFDEVIPASDFVFLAVDTPSTLAGAANLRNIRAATRSIAAALDGESPIIINKSTSPIGTGETIEGILRGHLGSGGREPRIVSNPEFLRQGRAVHDFFHPDRIVVGARSEDDARAVAALYVGLEAPVLLTDLRTAEMIKYVANSFLATRVSFINEIARLCEALGVDVGQVVEGVSHDPRIGHEYLSPGIGFGGTCLPKDVAALRFMGQTLGVATPVLSAVEDVNHAQRVNVVRRLRARLGGSLESRRIAVWGLTFKANTEDTRESPAMDIVHLLLNEGVDIHAYDPAAILGPTADSAINRSDSPLDAVHDADALLVLTEWPEFIAVSMAEVSSRMRGNLVFDGRNLLDPAVVEAAGLAYVGVGRSHRVHNRRSGD
jgi:UDPglucose 6-dehydrogenase